jgi:hypothetical protein
MNTGWRATLALVGIGLAAASVAQLRSYRAGQERLQELARQSGILSYEPGFLASLEREPDPWQARLLLARALFASSLTPSRGEALSADGPPAAGLRRLALARSLAAGVARERPAAWEAAMIQGASTYLGWSLLRDRRLLTRPEEWEAPLRRSLELAPGRPEPVRFLSAAYLELWPALSRGKRDEARGLLARALAHRPTFEALIAIWLRTAGSHREAFSAVPDQPWAWERLQQIEADEADWDAYRDARLRWYAALGRWMRHGLAEAADRLRGGDESRATLMFLNVLQTPPRRRFLPDIETALTQCPSGADGGSVSPAVGVWLDWTLDLCLWQGCPLPDPLLRRLAGLAGELPAATAARAAVVAGDLATGEAYERRAEDSWSAAWGPYGIARARALTERRELAEAARALDRVHPHWSVGAPYWTARLALARAAGDGVREAEARRKLSELRRREWSYREWTLNERKARLEIVPAAPSPGLSVEILEVPARGAAVEVRLDGEAVALSGAYRGDVLKVRHPLGAGVHLLEVEAVSGGRLVPGAVRLLTGS